MKLADDITYEDIAQWIDSGYFYFRDSERRVRLGKAHTFPKPLAPFLTVVDIGSTAEVPTLHKITSWEDITLFWPKCGYVNLPHVRLGVYVTRLQRRQWCRTYHPHCVSVALPLEYTIVKQAKEGELRLIRETQRSSTYKLVQQLFDPLYYSFSRAKEMMNREVEPWYTVALTSNTLLAKVGPEYYDLYYRGDYSGNIDGGLFTPANNTITRKVMKLFNGEVNL